MFEYNLHNRIPGSRHFIWREALYLPSLRICHIPSDEEIQHIITLAMSLDSVAEFLGVGLSVDCWIRPTSVNDGGGRFMGVNYNALPHINGAPHSAHITGEAADVLPVGGISVDAAQSMLEPKLPSFKLSMEHNGSAKNRIWLHLQSRPMADGTFRMFEP